MVQYVCDRCGYTTKRKSNFRNHLYRKKTCPPLIEDVDIEMIQVKYDFDLELIIKKKKNKKIHNKIHNKKGVPPKKGGSENHPKTTLFKQKTTLFKQNSGTRTTQKPPFLSKIKQKKISESDDEFEFFDVSEKNEKFFCDFCDRKFSSKKHKYRHQKHNCKMRKNLDSKNKEFQLESEIEKLRDEIKKKDDKIATMEHTNVSNVQNNINNINIKEQNIIINNYRDENIDYITNKVLEKLITASPFTSIPRLMECIHFNSKHPENHNLAITNIRSKFARIRKNNIWQVKFLNELLEELVNTKFNIIDEYYEFSGIKERLGWKAENYEKYRKLLFKDDKIRDRIKKSLFESIINFTKELELKCT